MKNIFKLILVLSIFSCNFSGKQSSDKSLDTSSQNSAKMLIDSTLFNSSIDGAEVKLYTLKNKNGLVTQITNLGGRVVNLFVPDRDGLFEDIVLGFKNPQSYLQTKEKYFGALIGRYGNRISQGEFTIEKSSYKLARNNGENHLHGGPKGYHDVIWTANQIDDQQLELKYLSPDGEEGYPGNLEIKVIYSLTEKNELKIEYWATSDQPTIVNLTHHSFFNLKGAGNGSINDHILTINADTYTPVDEGLIPTGEIAPVEGTPMDFRQPTEIGTRLEEDFQQLQFGKGYDHNYVLNQSKDDLTFAARVVENSSGRIMDVRTNEPGLQFYGGNFLDGTVIGKGGNPYVHRSAFCLETQHFPDSPNHSNFPSTLLLPDEQYQSICVYTFSTE